MNDDNISGEIRIGVIGLGYVGLHIALLFSTKYAVTGFDLNPDRVKALNSGTDYTCEVASDRLLEAIAEGFVCTDDTEKLRGCNFYVVAVPTPVDANNIPDLGPLLKASDTVGRALGKGDYVVYESTVYPGVTEEECIPILERESGLRLNVDFFAGYSPERVNPGDKVHVPSKIVKVTSGSSPEAAARIDELYDSVLEGGTWLAPSIRVAEASKILENVQRDVNIALMNEAAKIFNAMGIDTRDVLRAASTKWNFLPFEPGLVGGHCISVDPYYLIRKAEVYGVYPRIMSEARRLNDGMGSYVAAQTLRCMNRKGITAAGARILILGFTFKENCPDIRNTKVIDIVTSLEEYSDSIVVCDPWADASLVKRLYGIDLLPDVPDGQFEAIILAVAHDSFRSLRLDELRAPLSVVYDVKGFWEAGVADGGL
jgi:UDP-N-acetyl-D-galactosamine dehydrogenase